MISVVLAHVESNIADHVQPFDLAPAGYSAIDHAWNLGYDAAMESLDFEDVFPPADLTPAEARAFREGSVEGFRAKEFEIDDARDSSLDDWQVEELYEEWCYRNGLDYDRADYGHNANEWETV